MRNFRSPLTRTTGSELRITASDYLLYRRCPRSLHLRLIGAAPPSHPADTRYPVPSDRLEVRDLALAHYSKALTDPSCTHGPFVAAADVRRVQKPSGHAVILVRDGTSVKESYLREAAFVDFCFTRCGAKPQRIYVQHVNKAYRRCGPIDPDALFVQADVTRRVATIAPQTAEELERFSEELEADPLLTRYHEVLCQRPRTCPSCSELLPERDAGHVSRLHRGGPLVDELLGEGITRIVDIPPDRLRHRRHEIQQNSLRTETPYVDARALRTFLDRLAYPVCYLDFEALCTAIPPFDHVRPWEHVPFLYSVHREQSDRAISHAHYLMEPGKDSRVEMAERLASDLDGCGSVVAYSAGFERGVLKRLMDVCPDAAVDLQHAVDRVVDLLEPFHEFAVYHHRQRGKVSLKYVLPALTDLSYSGQTVCDGYTANLVYRYLSSDEVPAESSGPAGAQLLADLVSYCALDTMAMVHVVRELRRMAS